jgi:hypothetical protein
MTSDENDLITTIKEILNESKNHAILKKEALIYKKEQKDLIEAILKTLEEESTIEYANSILEKAKKKLKK